MKTNLSLLTAIALQMAVLSNVNTLTDAERKEAIAQNTAGLQAAMNAGDMDMVIQRADALKLLQKASKPAGGGNTSTRENRALRTGRRRFQTFQDSGFSLTPVAGCRW